MPPLQYNVLKYIDKMTQHLYIQDYSSHEASLSIMESSYVVFSAKNDNSTELKISIIPKSKADLREIWIPQETNDAFHIKIPRIFGVAPFIRGIIISVPITPGIEGALSKRAVAGVYGFSHRSVS